MKNSNLKALVARTNTVNNADFTPLNDKLASVIKGGLKQGTDVNFGCSQTTNSGCGTQTQQ
jgi:hypothetical protein